MEASSNSFPQIVALESSGMYSAAESPACFSKHCRSRAISILACLALAMLLAGCIAGCSHNIPRESIIGTWNLSSVTNASGSYDSTYMLGHSIEPGDIFSITFFDEEDAATMSFDGASMLEDGEKITWRTTEESVVLSMDGGDSEFAYDESAGTLTYATETQTLVLQKSE